MPTTAPLKITLYDKETSDVKATFIQGFIPWRFLKAAIRLARKLAGVETSELDEATLEEITGLIVDVFGRRFTANDLDEGADVGEMLTVLNAIVAKAKTLTPNAPPPTG